MARLLSGRGRRAEAATGVFAESPVPYTLPPASRELSAVSADGARLHIETYGREGDPAVVLVHGWTCSTLFWAPVIRELASSGHRVVVYDQRGHGRTPVGETRTYSTATLADDLCAVLDATLEPGEKAVVGGHSMGAMTLAAAAGRKQLEERAAALMLCSTGVRRLMAEARVLPFRGEGARTRAHKLLLNSRAPLGPQTPVTRKALKYGTMGPRATPVQVKTVAGLVHGITPRARGTWGVVLGGLDLLTGVRALTAPTAVVVGTADRLTPAVHAREIAAALPHCTGTHELPGRGHMVPLEEPETVAGVLTSLVREYLVPARASASAAARGAGAAKGAGGAKSSKSAENVTEKATESATESAKGTKSTKGAAKDAGGAEGAGTGESKEETP